MTGRDHAPSSTGPRRRPAGSSASRRSGASGDLRETGAALIGGWWAKREVDAPLAKHRCPAGDHACVLHPNGAAYRTPSLASASAILAPIAGLTAFFGCIIFCCPRPNGLVHRVPDRYPALSFPCCSKEDVVMRTYDFFPPLSLDRWLRPPVRLARSVGANGFAAELAAVQRRADGRGRLPDHNGPRWLLPA